jgi:hypothetical protein
LNAAIMFLVYEELSNQVYRVAGVVDRWFFVTTTLLFS